MKQKPEFVLAEKNMQPGVITAEGFLGNDTRHIADIIEADEELLSELGISAESLATKMQELLEVGKRGLGEPITIEGRWLIRVDETRGFLPSPFGGDGIYRKLNAELEYIGSGLGMGKKLIYNELCIHLIEKYHFFQGRGSPFRIEPKLAKEVLFAQK